MPHLKLHLIRLAEVSAKALGFVEVADGRVSRLHCMIQADMFRGLPLHSRLPAPATVGDHSANGTFLNGERLVKGERRALRDGDRLSLVLSLSPMIERSYTFRLGEKSPGVEPALCTLCCDDPLQKLVMGLLQHNINATRTEGHVVGMKETACDVPCPALLLICRRPKDEGGAGRNGLGRCCVHFHV